MGGLTFGVQPKERRVKVLPFGCGYLGVISSICIAIDLRTKVDDLDIEFVLCVAFLQTVGLELRMSGLRCNLVPTVQAALG